jgi:hypothetical protein
LQANAFALRTNQQKNDELYPNQYLSFKRFY